MGMAPTDTKCLMCGTVFQQPIRPQGGGRHSIYCSHRCSALHWARGNRGRRKAIILKYESRPENKEKKAARQRKKRLDQYGVTEDWFQETLWKQNFRCDGCRKRINQRTARIDHDHHSGQVRGLLCDSCNWTLGHSGDDPFILRELARYLEEWEDIDCQRKFTS